MPPCLWNAVMVWRTRPIGYLLSAVLVVKGFTMAAAIVAMLISAWATEGKLEVQSLVVFGLFAAGLGWLGLRMYAPPRSIQLA